MRRGPSHAEGPLSCYDQRMMIVPLSIVDRLKQVDDHAECDWLLAQLPAREAKLLWDHFALQIPLELLARREGMSVGRLIGLLDQSVCRLQTLDQG